MQQYGKQSFESALEKYFKLHLSSESPRSRMTEDFYADGHIPVRNSKGALFRINPADRFESIKERGDVLRCDFSLQDFFSFEMLPFDDPAVDLTEARFDLPDGDVRISDLNRQVND